MLSRVSYFVLAGMLLVSLRTHAVLFYSTGNTAYNTTEPTGALQDSGWQFQGRFLQYLGTPVSAHHFITAQHFGGSVGNTFIFDGTTYTTIAKIPDPGSDLVLYEVDGTFPRYAPLYDSSDEDEKDLVVFGRGVDRGVAVTNTITTDPPGPRPPTVEVITNGWEWGAYNYTQRWGENNVAGYADYAVGGDQKLLRAEFNSGAGVNECMLTDKDSGGAVFINDGAVWKLAGINLGIGPAGPFSFSSDGSNPFNASIIDFSGDDTVYLTNGTPMSASQKSSFYSTRISSQYTWISSSIPEFDQDVDGLPDWWETLYVGNPTSMDPDDDSLDGDGFTNYEEWIADTIPNDGNSYLQVSAYTNVTEIAFDSSTARKYQIEFRTDLADTNEQWQTEVAWFEPTSSQTVLPVSTSTSNRVYRVRAKLR